MSSFVHSAQVIREFFFLSTIIWHINLYVSHAPIWQLLDPDLQKCNFSMVRRIRDWRLGWRLCQKWNGSCNLSNNTNTSALSGIFSYPGACLWSQILLMDCPAFHWAAALCGTGLGLCHWMARAHLTVLDGGSPPGQMEETDLDLPPLAALKFSEWKSNAIRVHWCLSYYTS